MSSIQRNRRGTACRASPPCATLSLFGLEIVDHPVEHGTSTAGEASAAANGPAAAMLQLERGVRHRPALALLADEVLVGHPYVIEKDEVLAAADLVAGYQV